MTCTDNQINLLTWKSTKLLKPLNTIYNHLQYKHWYLSSSMTYTHYSQAPTKAIHFPISYKGLHLPWTQGCLTGTLWLNTTELATTSQYPVVILLRHIIYIRHLYKTLTFPHYLLAYKYIVHCWSIWPLILFHNRL